MHSILIKRCMCSNLNTRYYLDPRTCACLSSELPGSIATELIIFTLPPILQDRNYAKLAHILWIASVIEYCVRNRTPCFIIILFPFYYTSFFLSFLFGYFLFGIFRLELAVLKVAMTLTTQILLHHDTIHIMFSDPLQRRSSPPLLIKSIAHNLFGAP